MRIYTSLSYEYIQTYLRTVQSNKQTLNIRTIKQTCITVPCKHTNKYTIPTWARAYLCANMDMSHDMSVHYIASHSCPLHDLAYIKKKGIVLYSNYVTWECIPAHDMTLDQTQRHGSRLITSEQKTTISLVRWSMLVQCISMFSSDFSTISISNLLLVASWALPAKSGKQHVF